MSLVAIFMTYKVGHKRPLMWNWDKAHFSFILDLFLLLISLEFQQKKEEVS